MREVILRSVGRVLRRHRTSQGNGGEGEAVGDPGAFQVDEAEEPVRIRQHGIALIENRRDTLEVREAGRDVTRLR